jgi:hypothetical protein
VAAPPPPAPAPAPAPREAPVAGPVRSESPATMSAGEGPRQSPAGDVAPPGRRARGQGGRPRSLTSPRPTAAASTGQVSVPVRVPPELYEDINQDLLSGPERPSYGQLVIWACEDHPDAVLDSVRKARTALRGSRRPRGHRLAAADVQITLKLSHQERDLLDEVAAQVGAQDGKPVTRKEVAIAALKQALLRAD